MRTNRDDILVNPQTVIRLFARSYLVLKGDLLYKREYKVTREAWITSMYLLALQHYKKGRDWWLKPNPEDNSPDFFCSSFVRSEKDTHTVKLEMDIDVFEWR